MDRDMRTGVILGWLAVSLAAGVAWAQQKPAIDPAKLDLAVKSAFPTAGGDWLARLKGDQTMEACSASREAPSAEVARLIEAREKATIEYPTDGKLIGDWKKGEQLAQSG